MLKLVPAIVDTREFSGSSGSYGNQQQQADGSRRNLFVCHIPTPLSCTLMSNRNQRRPASPLTQCFWTFFWLAVLIFVAYPLGIIAGQLYIIVSPFSQINFCKKLLIEKLTSSLLWTMHLPLICSQNMIIAKELVETI